MNTPENKQGKESVFKESLKRPYLWLVILVVILTITFYLLDIQASWDSSVLTLLLNIVFVVIPAFFIALVSSQGFLQSGSWQVMWLGVGAFTYGLAVLLSFWVKTWASANAQTTTFAIVYLLASLFFFIGSLLVLNKAYIKTFSSSPRRLTNLSLIYFIVVALISLTTFVSVRELLPPFFIQGEGSTDLRIILQIIALVLFLVSGLLIITNYLKSKTAFLLWYGLGLILTVVNTAGNLVLTSFGTPLNWVLRGAQLLAGVYLLMAAVTILREAKAKHVPAAKVIVDPFTQLETRLKESEQRFLNVFLASPVAQTIARLPEGRWVEVNDSFLRMLGFTRGEVIGHTSAELNIIDPDERARILQDVIDKGSQRGKEITVRTKAGEGLTVLSFNEKIAFNGQDHSISTLLDITERKKAEEALQRRQNELQALFDFSDASLALFDAKPPYTVLAHNKYYQRLWSEPFKTYGMVGKNLLDYVPEVEAQGVMAVYDEVVKTKKPKSLINFPYEGMPQGKTWWNWHLSPVIQNGEVISLTHIGINVTEEVTARQKVEEQARLLEEKNEQLKLAQRAANAGTWHWDITSGKLTWSFELFTLFGLAPTEPSFEIWLKIIHPDDRQKAMGNVNKAVENHDFLDSEYRIVRHDGTARWISALGNTVYDKDDKPQIMSGICIDITERKKAEEELKRYTAELEVANKELESFAYSVSHDLRTPLRTLDGFSEMVIMDYGDKLDETGKNYLNRIRKAGQTMSQLTEDILKLSRITRAEMHRDEVNLSEMAKSIADELKATQPERQAEFIVAPSIIAKGDKALLQILLRNLLENSWKYTSQCSNAKIEFGTSRQQGRTVYFIKDNGIGFDMKYSDKLFQPFQRLHTNKEYPGTGIGLATAQRVIRRHGGDIWADSEMGKGTTFYFILS